MHKIFYGEVETPIGTLSLLMNGDQLIRIDFGPFSENEEKINKWVQRFFAQVEVVHAPDKIQVAGKQLEEYFHKKRTTFDVPIAFYGTDFQKQVWQMLEKIPFGKTTSYKDIANSIAKPKAVRAVGGAIGNNPLSIIVPCHRVIGTSKKLVGYNGGLDKKEFLLKHEEILL